MAPLCCEKGSCRHRVEKCALLEEDMCTECQRQSKFSGSKFRELIDAGIEQKVGVCQRLHGAIEQQAVDISMGRNKRVRRPTQSSSQAGNSSGRELGFRRRNNKKKRRKSFIALTTTVKTLQKYSNLDVHKKPQLTKGILACVTKGGTLSINMKSDASKATQKRTKRSARQLLDGVASMATASQPGLFRDTMVAASYKANPVLKPPAPIVDRGFVWQPSSNTNNATVVLPRPAASREANRVVSKDTSRKVTEAKVAAHDAFAKTIKDRFSGPQDRRPYLAVYGSLPKPMVEEMTCIPINDPEWNKIRLHQRWPGPLKPAPKVQHYRLRVKLAQLKRLLTMLDAPGNLQRYAFGSKLLHILRDASGSQTVVLDNIDRMKKASTLTAEYIMALETEVNGALDDAKLPDDVDRCDCKEKYTNRRCRKKQNHKNSSNTEKHKFTGESSLSFSTVVELIKTLTGNDIKRLAGLDDVKVLKGRDNFKRLRRLAEATIDSVTERKAAIQRVDECEVFYLTDYQDHLQRVGTQRCNCLTCGFTEPENKEGIECPGRHSHGNSCVKCTAGYAIIHDLTKKAVDKKTQIRERREDMPEEQLVDSNLELQEMEELEAEVMRAATDLTDYRSHLARHKAEAEFDAEELATLPDDVSLVISDFKMKILPLFFRENQRKWFGKRGITCLGFMIISNSTHDEARQNGVKDVIKFVMMFTDDTLQDEHEVACAKFEVYSNHLPIGVDKVIFQADGAGCFRSVYNRIIQPYWKAWTGIQEIVYRITPAGAGKSSLDGMFGRMNVCLNTSADTGNDFLNATTICEALEDGGGMAATEFLKFQPQRDGRMYGAFDESSIDSVLRSELNPSKPFDRSITVFKHSGYGSGRRIYPSDAALSIVSKPMKSMVSKDHNLLFYRKKTDKKKKKEKLDKLVSHILQFCGQSYNKDEPLRHIMRTHLEYPNYLCEILPAVRFRNPSCKLVQSYSNKKQEVQSVMSVAGKGANHPDMRQKRRENRVSRRVNNEQESTESIRHKKQQAGIFLCEQRCPETFHYCRKEYLTYKGLHDHLSNHCCDFPKGISAKDKLVLMASKAGGLMHAGSRVNRKKDDGQGAGEKMFESAPEDAPGSAAANCFQAFNRKEEIDTYRKPMRLILALVEIFNIEPKLSPEQAWEEIRTWRDPADGGLMFCWSKRGTFMPATGKHKRAYEAWAGCPACGKKPCDCNGMLPTIAMIASYFSALAKKKKVKGKAAEQAEAVADALAELASFN